MNKYAMIYDASERSFPYFHTLSWRCAFLEMCRKSLEKQHSGRRSRRKTRGRVFRGLRNINQEAVRTLVRAAQEYIENNPKFDPDGRRKGSVAAARTEVESEAKERSLLRSQGGSGTTSAGKSHVFNHTRSKSGSGSSGLHLEVEPESSRSIKPPTFPLTFGEFF